MGTSSFVDLVIVGAGAAGLAAARTARDLGLTFVVFEAMPRVGGRAHTDPRPFGVPWDRGCHWLHSADANPFTRLADEYGFRYRTEPAPWRKHLGDRWADPDEQRAADAFIVAGYEAATVAARGGRDVPMAEVIDRDDRWLWSLRAVVAAEWGVAIDAASTGDIGRYRDTNRNWPVRDGYGALVVRHAADLPVTLATPVERIDWGGERVRVTTPRGTVEAGAVIVTVSTGVLAADVIRFEPALPVWKQEAIAAVPLGKANKVAIQLDGRRLGVDEHTSVLVPVGDGAISFQFRPFGWDLATGYLAGPFCDELEGMGEAAMVDAALGGLRSVLGADAVRDIGATACTGWGREPFVRGAYGMARPGEAHRRPDLAVPLADRLFFAGEATSPDFFSTCHGAHLTGIAAAEQAAATLGRA